MAFGFRFVERKADKDDAETLKSDKNNPVSLFFSLLRSSFLILLRTFAAANNTGKSRTASSL